MLAPQDRPAIENVAVLFWFYRDLPVCRNRLELLRRTNPHSRIYGVYGGDPADADRFRSALAPLLDDFWVYERDVSSKWKWLHGDLMLLAWYEERGRHLAWDRVFVVQWDMLVVEPVAQLCPPLAPDEVLLCGVRPVAAVEPAWPWSKGGHEPRYRAFVDMMRDRFGAVEPLSCVFVIAGLPRRLFDAYALLPDPEVGFVEYRLPTLAAAAGMRVVEDERFAVWRPADVAAGPPTRRQRYLNGARHSIHLPTVLRERRDRDGARVFHPYHGLYPYDVKAALAAAAWAPYAGFRTARNSVRTRVAKLRGR